MGYRLKFESILKAKLFKSNLKIYVSARTNLWEVIHSQVSLLIEYACLGARDMFFDFTIIALIMLCIIPSGSEFSLKTNHCHPFLPCQCHWCWRKIRSFFFFCLFKPWNCSKESAEQSLLRNYLGRFCLWSSISLHRASEVQLHRCIKEHICVSKIESLGVLFPEHCRQ